MQINEARGVTAITLGKQLLYALFAGVYERAGAKGRLYYIIVVVYTQVTRKLRRFGHKKDLVNRSFRGRNNEKQGFLAGVAGFEPTNDGVRARKKLILPLKIIDFSGFLPQYLNYTQIFKG